MGQELIETNSRKEIKWATVVSYISILLNILVGLFFTPWLIHAIGDSDYGIYSIATSIITLLIMDFGISEAVAKYVAQYRTQGREDEINNLLGLVLKIYLLLSIIFFLIFLVFYFLINNIYVGLTTGEIIKLKQVYIIIAVYNVFAFAFTPLSGIMLAYEHLITLKFADIITRIVTVVISIVLVSVGGGLFSVVLANVLAGIITILYKLYIIQSNHRFKPNFRCRDSKLLKNMISFSIWIAIMVIAQRCIYSITPSILGALSNSTEVTYFSLASTLEGYAYSFGSVLASLYLARLTRILLSNDEEEFNNLIIRTGKLQLILILLILAGFICAGRSFINVWMGSGYSIVYYCTILLLLPDMLLWPFMVPATGLTVLNQIKEYSLVHVAMAVINIILEAFLLSEYGSIGAAVAICVATFVKAFLVIGVYKKHLPMNMNMFLKKVFLPYGSVGLLTLIISYFVLSIIPNLENELVNFIIETVLTVIIYFIGVLIVIITKDKDLKYDIEHILKVKRK